MAKAVRAYLSASDSVLNLKECPVFMWFLRSSDFNALLEKTVTKANLFRHWKVPVNATDDILNILSSYIYIYIKSEYYLLFSFAYNVHHLVNKELFKMSTISYREICLKVASTFNASWKYKNMSLIRNIMFLILFKNLILCVIKIRKELNAE